MIAVTEAKERLRLAVAEYDTAREEFENADEEQKTELAWKCVRLHRKYREAFTGVMKAILVEQVGRNDEQEDVLQAMPPCEEDGIRQ